MNLGIIGCGAIGNDVAKVADTLDEIQNIYLFDIDITKANDLKKILKKAAVKTFNEFIKKVLYLKQKGFKGGVCYLAYPPQMDKINFYSKEFEKNGIGFALAAFWGIYDGKSYPQSYSEKEKEMMKPYLGDMNRVTYHLEGKKTKGKLCRAGNVYASIKADGKVTRCGPLSHKPIGNIFDDNFKLFSDPMPCEAEVCPCDEYIWLVEK